MTVVVRPGGGDQAVLLGHPAVEFNLLEADCPKHTPEQVELYRRMAKEHGLIAIAGSDYHGHKSSRVRLGACRVDKAVVEALADLASKSA